MLSLILLLSFSGCAETQSKEAEPQSSSQVEQSSQTTETSSEPTVSKMEDFAESSVNQSTEKNKDCSTEQTNSDSNSSQVIAVSSSEPSSSIDQSELQSSSSRRPFIDNYDFCIDELTKNQRNLLKQYSYNFKRDNLVIDKMKSYREFLKTELEPDDYLGFDCEFSSGFIIIKIVNLDNVKPVVASYPPDSFKVLYEKVEYSLADLKAIEQEFKEQPFYKNNPSSIHTNIEHTGVIEYQIDNIYPELDQWLEDTEYGDFFIEVDGSEKTNPA